MNTENPSTPIDIARQALKQLALRKVPPTPDNFHAAYDEIAGAKSEDGSTGMARVLEKVLREAGKGRPKFLAAAKTISGLAEKRDWAAVEAQLRGLLLATRSDGGAHSWSTVLRNLIRQLEVSHKGLTSNKKKEGLERVLTNFEKDPEQLAQKIQALVASWGSGVSTPLVDEVVAPVTAVASAVTEPAKSTLEAGALALLWRDILIRTLEMGCVAQLKDIPSIARQGQALLEQARSARTEPEVVKLSEALKPFWYALEMNQDAQHRLQEELMHLLRLLVDNMSELVVDDKWLFGQTAIIRDIISKPIDIDVLYDAESSLKELIFKQGKLKHGLVEAKDTLKQMAATFISSLAGMTETTGEYHKKIETYRLQISSTEDITELNVILDKLMGDTKAMQLDALRSHEDLKAAQIKVVDAEQRIEALTTELDHVSEMAHEDYLTGALNRRGMDAALEREFSRSDRFDTRICVAMMDIDHFKRLNDTLGHDTGDVALAHLAKVTKAALRPTDVLARFGGEEFIIILPETEMEEAMQVMTRVQRDLTRQFFLHNNERVLMTFSAGVAQRQAGEDSGSVMKRADLALYQAKQTGRNRVISAD